MAYQITVITVGKVKEKFMQQGVAEYAKRLSRYCKLSFVEIPDEKTPDNLSEAEMEQVKHKEGEGILKQIKEGGHVVALEIKGQSLTSEAFADQLEQWAVSGVSQLYFVIGGSLGLSQAVLNRANTRLSFSKMTFPHQLMKIILLEQIYRGFRIMKGEPYHK